MLALNVSIPCKVAASKLGATRLPATKEPATESCLQHARWGVKGTQRINNPAWMWPRVLASCGVFAFILPVFTRPVEP